MRSGIIVHYVWFAVMMAVVAFAIVWLLFPYVLYYARRRRLYDSPNYRKLQRRPVPLLGGVAVYGGILVPSLIVLIVWQNSSISYMLLAMTILLVLGTMDDLYDLSPLLKLLIEFLVVLAVVYLNGNSIDTLHGLFGIGILPVGWQYAISLLAGVGIINAINLIDGVDGYSSGYTFFAAVLFGTVFALAGMPGMTSISFIVAGAVVPFFLHNVFGRKSKMFMGDGGTLMIGTLISAFLFSILKTGSSCSILETQHGASLVALCLAVLGIPIFDTLRLIFYRLSLRRSPFSADRNHLHHAFIDLGCSHLATTLSILAFNLLIVLIWLFCWLGGAGQTAQVVVVVLACLIVTWGLFFALRLLPRRRTRFYKRLRVWALTTHHERSRLWCSIQSFLDRV
ncbi:MAG: UDP-N-acetylmuramyl pentapeptide phosphotransferase/UDP-N-acetylglucosamine-1-phosphate transferase [bacterium P3]|nr:MAG: UDP-N-acetylmuramyl pentapeptide phosphotransferase/UDP-N-acetylglucosamine-1-phosphate transferase [bacterium P3]KWW42322.1 MAG: UDP-N-acetylmuramyl pentapeptide phosphotransferase/UDP-N-acetylglucosamine-1-phosphate transferase [bacterium F083]